MNALSMKDFEKAVALAGSDTLELVYTDLMVGLMPDQDDANLNSKLDLIQQKMFMEIELAVTPTDNHPDQLAWVDLTFKDADSGVLLRKYQLGYLPNWLKPLAKRMRYSADHCGFYITCNTKDENLDGSIVED